MKKTIRMLLLLAVFIAIHTTDLCSQVTIIPLPHQEGVFTLENIWAVNLTNPLSGPIQAQLEVSIEDDNHHTILTGISPTFMVPRGVSRANFNVSASSFTFGNIPGARLLKSTGRFPYGNYTVCYQLTSSKGLLGNYCQEETIRPFSPPELISPYNNEEVSTLLPLLIWKPPFPPGDAGITYGLMLTVLKDGQSPLEALEKNVPLLNLNNLTVTALTYPGGAAKLEYGKQYVWQITAQSGGFDLGTTEVWVFKPEQTAGKLSTITDEGYFTLMNTPNSGHHPIHFQELRFLLENQYTTDALSASPPSSGNDKVIYEIYHEGDRSAQVDMTVPSDITLISGSNKITLTLSGTGFINSHRYLLIVRDITGKESFLDFIYNDN